MAELKLSRPENDKDFPQKSVDKDMMSYLVFFGVTKKEAYLRFHPYYLNQRTGGLNDVGVIECQKFFVSPANKEYIAAYKDTLRKRLSGVELNVPGDSESAPIDASRKKKAVEELLVQAMRIVERGEMDPDTLKVVTEIFKRLNLLTDDVEIQEKPRRYLPVLCMKECQYRLFCESGIESGEIVNECDYCKALAYAKERGYHYDPTKNLSIPQKSESEEPGKPAN